VKPRDLALICFLLILPGERVFAAKWPLDVPKGATVVVKAPLRFWHPEAVSFSTGTPIFSVDAGILAKQDWETAGLPYFGEFVVTKVFEWNPRYKAPGLPGRFTEVELRNKDRWVKLRFQPGSDIARGFRDLTFTGTWSDFEASDYFKSVVFGKVGAKIFSGTLAKVPERTRLTLLRIAGTGLADVSSGSYKDKLYVKFDFPLGGTVYNSIKLNQGARVATVINSRLAMLKELAVLAADAGVDGVKISEMIRHENFASGAEFGHDNLELYAPLPAIKQLHSADITSQQFIDQCIVIVNGDRVQVSLSSGS
jgi:hypothetical protein